MIGIFPNIRLTMLYKSVVFGSLSVVTTMVTKVDHGNHRSEVTIVVTIIVTILGLGNHNHIKHSIIEYLTPKIFKNEWDF